MKIITTDNNEWISSVTGKPLNAKGKVVKEGDPDAIRNPAFGTTTEMEVDDPPAPPKSWDAFDFKMRFTSEERKKIRATAKTNADVEDFEDMLNTAAATGTRIVSTNALVRDGLTLMENNGLIDPGRAAEILGD